MGSGSDVRNSAGSAGGSGDTGRGRFAPGTGDGSIEENVDEEAPFDGDIFPLSASRPLGRSLGKFGGDGEGSVQERGNEEL
jgi:hypothetical protein